MSLKQIHSRAEHIWSNISYFKAEKGLFDKLVKLMLICVEFHCDPGLSRT